MSKAKKLPICAVVYKFTSKHTKNTKGKFYKWDVETVGQIQKVWGENFMEIYTEARDLSKAASELNKRVDYSAARDAEDTVTPTSDADRVM